MDGMQEDEPLCGVTLCDRGTNLPLATGEVKGHRPASWGGGGGARACAHESSLP